MLIFPGVNPGGIAFKMKYSDAVTESMNMLAKEENVIFLGYNINFGSLGYGTLKDIPKEKRIETPLAENLMTGLAIGMSLEGYRPIIFFERHDFMLNALDGLINHSDKIKEMSKGQFEPLIIVRAVIGGTKPLNPGAQHTQDFTEAFRKLIKFPIYKPETSKEVIEAYNLARESKGPVMIIEKKDLYGQDFELNSRDIQKMNLTNKELDNNQLILDGTKLAWHKERVEAWLRGERIAPITVDCALTRRCNYKCAYCYGQLQANDEKKMTKEVIFRFLDDCADVGVKGVSFVSDGESTCSPHVYDAIIYGKKRGLDMALATNGSLLEKERLKEILPCLTYLRFNISAGEPKRYAEIMGCREEFFFKVKEIIKECVKIKKENKLSVTIGMQMVLLPSFSDQIIPLAKLGKELGADYLVIKHCSDDEDRSLGVDYSKYFDQNLIDKIKEAESYSTKDYLVKAKWSKILSGGERDYSRCYGPPFIIQLSGSGLVAPCGMLFNEKYRRYHIGNIADTPFKEILKSERYWEVMNFISSEKFDAKTMCGTLCLQHKCNEFLDALKEGKIEYKAPEGNPPMHLNFI